jgi:hypothetical protein
MAAGEGPAKEPNRRVNMEAMVGNWFCCNKKRKEGVGWWWEAPGITLYFVDVCTGAGGCDPRLEPDDVNYRMANAY